VTEFLYQYIVGGLIFISGFIIAWRSKDYSWKNKEDRTSAYFLLLIFLVYFTGHLTWIHLASGGG